MLAVDVFLLCLGSVFVLPSPPEALLSEKRGSVGNGAPWADLAPHFCSREASEREECWAMWAQRAGENRGISVRCRGLQQQSAKAAQGGEGNGGETALVGILAQKAGGETVTSRLPVHTGSGLSVPRGSAFAMESPILCDCGEHIKSHWLLSLKYVLPDLLLQRALIGGGGSAFTWAWQQDFVPFLRCYRAGGANEEKAPWVAPLYDSIIQSVLGPEVATHPPLLYCAVEGLETLKRQLVMWHSGEPAPLLPDPV